MSERGRHFRRRRANLVVELREKGIVQEHVLAAIGAVPREDFVEPAMRARAYLDQALPIGNCQTISQPFTVAYQTALLDPQPGERILEIGTGSGYQAAVLCELGVRVFTVERHRALHDRARRVLRGLGYRVYARFGDGTQGWQALAPFDGIIVTAGAVGVPDPLLTQLAMPTEGAEGGRLVIPVGGGRAQVMKRIMRVGRQQFETENGEAFRFVPLVAG